MTGDDNPREQLRRRITRGIVLQTGTYEQIAMQYTDAVMQVLYDVRGENGNVYVPAPERRYDVLQIRAALERGVPTRKVQCDFGIGRTALFNLFPGGLPRHRKNAAKR